MARTGRECTTIGSEVLEKPLEQDMYLQLADNTLGQHYCDNQILSEADFSPPIFVSGKSEVDTQLSRMCGVSVDPAALIYCVIPWETKIKSASDALIAIDQPDKSETRNAVDRTMPDGTDNRPDRMSRRWRSINKCTPDEAKKKREGNFRTRQYRQRKRAERQEKEGNRVELEHNIAELKRLVDEKQAHVDALKATIASTALLYEAIGITDVVDALQLSQLVGVAGNPMSLFPLHCAGPSDDVAVTHDTQIPQRFVLSYPELS